MKGRRLILGVAITADTQGNPSELGAKPRMSLSRPVASFALYPSKIKRNLLHKSVFLDIPITGSMTNETIL